MYAEMDGIGRVYKYPTIIVKTDCIPTKEHLAWSKEQLTNRSGLNPTKVSYKIDYEYKKFLFFYLKKPKHYIMFEFENSYYKSVDRIKKLISRKLGYDMSNLIDYSYENFKQNL
jgi:ABC-type microcin C transport system permease subunit YejB